MMGSLKLVIEWMCKWIKLSQIQTHHEKNINSLGSLRKWTPCLSLQSLILWTSLKFVDNFVWD